uniref:ATP-binding protein n=1 Tax=Streptomyces sp. NBC_00049 TaxID=2903617 RepID=A0AAU2JU77_9ACTN
MKQSAAKTLGVAALGAAFAVVAAGNASAVGLTDALGTATGAVQGLTSQQHMGAEQGQESSDPGAALAPVTGLLGGLPTSGLGG